MFQDDSDDDVIFIGETYTCSSTLDQEPKNVDIYVNASDDEEIVVLQKPMDQAACECLQTNEVVNTSPLDINVMSFGRDDIIPSLREHEESAHMLKSLSEPVHRSKLLSYLGVDETDLYLDSTIVEDCVESKISSCQLCDFRTFRDITPHLVEHLIQRSCDACGQIFETLIALLAHRRFWCENVKEPKRRNRKISADSSERTEPSEHSEILVSCPLDEENSTCISNDEPEIIVIESDSELEMVEPVLPSPPLLLPTQHLREPRVKINLKLRMYHSSYIHGRLVNVCDCCSYSSSYFDKMERHITKWHPTCDNCDRTFKTNSGLLKHQRKCKLRNVNKKPISLLKKKVMRKNKKGQQNNNDMIKTSSPKTDADTVNKLEEEIIINDKSKNEEELNEAERAIFFLEAEERYLQKLTNWEGEGELVECQDLNDDRFRCDSPSKAKSRRGRALKMDEITRLDNRGLDCAFLAAAGRETLAEPDYAPLTKWLVQFHRDDQRLLVIPARKIQARALSKLYDRHASQITHHMDYITQNG